MIWREAQEITTKMARANYLTAEKGDFDRDDDSQD
jgi:hypothetical protein